MYNRVYRYNKPEAAVLLDILNFTNKIRSTPFKPGQLTFSTPVAISHTKTNIDVRPSSDTTLSSEPVTLEYHRHDLGTTFSENPFVIDVDEVDDQSLYEAILQQFKVLFEASAVTIIRTPLAEVINQQVLDGIDYSTLTDPDAALVPPPVIRDGTFNFTLQALPNSLIWVGETSLLVRHTAQLIDKSIATTLEIRKYLTETRDKKVPIELIYDIERDASEFGEVISERLSTGDEINVVSPFLNIARKLTNDNWVAVEQVANFNLNGSRVLYNGYNVDEFATNDARFSHILVVRIGPLCKNLQGVWTIQYNDPTVFHYDPCRVDRETPPDL